ncbi:hypothetical protein D3C72_1298990 [compost metagenome]
MLVTAHLRQPVARHQRRRQRRQHMVLPPLEGHVVRAFHFDTDGIAIALRASFEHGRARMPGTLTSRNILQQRTIAPHKKVRRHLQATQVGERRIGIIIYPARKQVRHMRPAEVAARQADVMDHQQVDLRTVRARIVVRRVIAQRAVAPAVFIYRPYAHQVKLPVSSISACGNATGAHSSPAGAPPVPGGSAPAPAPA